MTEFSTKGLAESWNRGLNGVLHFPGAIRNALNPATETDALRVTSQLKRVRSNVRALDYALPLVGAIVVFVHRGLAPLVAATPRSTILVGGRLLPAVPNSSSR